jgi:3-oxoacyl-[acyl-carrier-protein] synthase II
MTDWLPPEQRVVITGMGAVTPNGLDMSSSWANVRDGCSGIRPITLFDVSDYRVKIAGEAHGFDPLNYMTRKEARRADRFVQFALAAADEAVGHARLDTSQHPDEIGAYIGCGAGGIKTYQAQQAILDSRGPRLVNPLLVPMIVTDSAAVQVGIRLGVRGPNLGMSSACSTSLDAVGLALETIRRGDAQVMIAGGAEAAVNSLGISGFDQLNALSRRNDDPEGASRPFDRDRDGFVLSEGAVILVLESLAHARLRDAEPLAEVRSYAATSDARHLTAPDIDGTGGARCMARALNKACLAPDAVEYINAHATATPVGDPIEVHGIKAALGDHVQKVAVSSTKSVTGHLLGAAGAAAIAFTTAALGEGVLPPTVNLDNPDPECDLQHVANVARKTNAQVALVPSYGFGGHNSCAVVTKWNE